MCCSYSCWAVELGCWTRAQDKSALQGKREVRAEGGHRVDSNKVRAVDWLPRTALQPWGGEQKHEDVRI